MLHIVRLRGGKLLGHRDVVMKARRLSCLLILADIAEFLQRRITEVE